MNPLSPTPIVIENFTPSKKRAEHYQSEDALEKEFIKRLEAHAYAYLKNTQEEDLIGNLRTQLEKLNNYQFSEKECSHFFKTEIANPNQSIEEKTTTLQKDHIKVLKCDDGTSKKYLSA